MSKKYMKRNWATWIAMLFCFVGHASEYDVKNIAPELLENASVVIRLEEQVFDIKSVSKGQLTYRTVITILNKAGDSHAEFAEVYDKFSSISNIKAVLYDATGKKVREYGKSDIKDQSLISNFSVFEDDRVKYLRLQNNIYPYTIEYSYSKNYSGFLGIPSWRPVTTFGVAAEKSRYTLITDPSYSYKKLSSRDLQSTKETIKGRQHEVWQCENINAISYEPMSTGIDHLVPWLQVSPHEFVFDNVPGNTADWNAMGAWVDKLSTGSTALTPPIKSKVQSLIANATTDREKVDLLYQYLQKQTRYVSIQLGIGGFKPMSAEKVAQVDYGDCKALSNYMRALLHEAGIASHLVLIGSGRGSLNPDYASFGQANHMILTVPLASDTLFLECTSQNYPTGYIGESNANRLVLLVSEGQGTIVKTPEHQAKENFLARKADVKIAEDTHASITSKTAYGYAQYEDVLPMLIIEPVEQRKRLLNLLDIPSLQLTKFSYQQEDRSIPEIIEAIEATSSQLFTKGGDKLFLTLNLLNRRERIPPQVPDRKTFFKVSYQYQDEDEIVYHLPDGFEVEFLPENVLIESEFGTYKAEFVKENDKIIYRRTQQMNARRYPPEKYAEYIEFSRKIYQTDRLKAVLSKS